MEQSEVHDVLGLLQKGELLAEKVLRDREEIVQMDRIRNKNREAMNAIKRRPEEDSVYICVGNMFMKQRVKGAKKLIEDDQKNVNEHIEKLRRQIKLNVQTLQEIESKGDQYATFNLNPLSQEEMKGFNTVVKSIHKLQL